MNMTEKNCTYLIIDKIAKQDFAGWPNNDILLMYFIYFGIINYCNWNWAYHRYTIGINLMK